MKKILIFALLALAGVVTASAYGIYVNFNCPDGYHYSDYILVQDDLDDEEGALEAYYDEMMEKICGEKPDKSGN